MLKIAWNPIYNHPVPDGHRFPMEKYELLPEQLLYEGTIEKSNLFDPIPASYEDILAVHTPGYWDKLRMCKLTHREQLTSGFIVDDKLVEREIKIAGGTIQAAQYAFNHGIAMNVAGGTHHAYADRAEGFCLLNDLALAARWIQKTEMAEKVLILDLDVHQGNGTACIFQDDDSVFTLSFHGKNNYPLRKEASDLDIAFEDATNDIEYLETLDNHLSDVLKEFKPEFVLYQCGVDPLETDKLGKLSLTIDGIRERDEIVLKTCKTNRLPIVCTMGGGYSEDINVILEAHANTFRLAQEIFF